MGQVAAKRKYPEVKLTLFNLFKYPFSLNISTSAKIYSVHGSIGPTAAILLSQQHSEDKNGKSNTGSNNAPNQVKAIVPMPFGHTMCGATCYVLSALRDIAPKQIQWMVLFLSQHKKTNWRDRNSDERRRTQNK